MQPYEVDFIILLYHSILETAMVMSNVQFKSTNRIHVSQTTADNLKRAQHLMPCYPGMAVCQARLHAWQPYDHD